MILCRILLASLGQLRAICSQSPGWFTQRSHIIVDDPAFSATSIPSVQSDVDTTFLRIFVVSVTENVRRSYSISSYVLISVSVLLVQAKQCSAQNIQTQGPRIAKFFNSYLCRIVNMLRRPFCLRIFLLSQFEILGIIYC